MPSDNPAKVCGHSTSLPDWEPTDLTARIEPGELAPGTRLRSERDLAAHYEVADHTIRRAREVPRNATSSSSIHGRGTFVQEQQAPEP